MVRNLLHTIPTLVGGLFNLGEVLDSIHDFNVRVRSLQRLDEQIEAEEGRLSSASEAEVRALAKNQRRKVLHVEDLKKRTRQLSALSKGSMSAAEGAKTLLNNVIKDLSALKARGTGADDHDRRVTNRQHKSLSEIVSLVAKIGDELEELQTEVSTMLADLRYSKKERAELQQIIDGDRRIIKELAREEEALRRDIEKETKLSESWTSGALAAQNKIAVAIARAKEMNKKFNALEHGEVANLDPLVGNEKYYAGKIRHSTSSGLKEV